MYNPIIDAHTHLDLYSANERTHLLATLEKYNIQSLISVSFHLQSAQRNIAIANEKTNVKVAIGYHPEQKLPNERERLALENFMEINKAKMVAIGEVGLPYYLMQKDPTINQDAYIELLEDFIIKAKKWKKPIILHAIYEDADIVCDLLEKHAVKAAHFHWFKGSGKTVERMINNGYYISVTPDVCYEKEIKELVHMYPLTQLMVETDGPWQFAGEFAGQLTHPKMMHASIEEIANIKKIELDEVYAQLFQNTRTFFNL